MILLINNCHSYFLHPPKFSSGGVSPFLGGFSSLSFLVALLLFVAVSYFLFESVVAVLGSYGFPFSPPANMVD
jgi:hypothetical protein